MTKMLGHYGGGECGCTDCSPPRGRHSARLSSRWRKRIEARQWPADQLPASPLPSPFTDFSDCQHGCNGDCHVSGSEQCDFTCHGEIEDLVAEWHGAEPGSEAASVELREWLGMSQSEYADWVASP